MSEFIKNDTLSDDLASQELASGCLNVMSFKQNHIDTTKSEMVAGFALRYDGPQ